MAAADGRAATPAQARTGGRQRREGPGDGFGGPGVVFRG